MNEGGGANKKRRLKLALDSPFETEVTVYVPFRFLRGCVLMLDSARVPAFETAGVLEALRVLFATKQHVVCGANAVTKQLAANALAVVVVATQGITPPLLNRHLDEASAVARCPVCALAGLTSEALGAVVGLKRALSVGVMSTADATLLAPVLRVAVVPSLPWLQDVPGMLA